MQTDFRIRERDPLTVLSRRASVTLADIGEEISRSFASIYGLLETTGVRTDEPPFVIYHEAPGRGGRPFEIEVCAPVGSELEPPDGWACTLLPGGAFASVVHFGPYTTLGTAYDELAGWIARQKLAIAGPPREVYLSEPGTPPDDIRTVIEYPVVPSRAAVPVPSA